MNTRKKSTAAKPDVEPTEADVEAARKALIENEEFRAAVADGLKNEMLEDMTASKERLRKEMEKSLKAEVKAELREKLRPEIEAELGDRTMEDVRRDIATAIIGNMRQDLMKKMNKLAPSLKTFGQVSSISLCGSSPIYDVRDQIPGIVLSKDGTLSVIGLISTLGNWMFGERIIALGSPEDGVTGFDTKRQIVIKKEREIDPAVAAQFAGLDGDRKKG